MACLPEFPKEYSIPPASFYTIQGLPQWLNQNTSYKQYFIGVFPYLYKMTSTLSSLQYNVENVPLASNLTALSQGQMALYKQQFQVFYKVYTHNSNAYVNYVCSSVPPMYYTFTTYKEKTEYDSALSLVNRLYPFGAMADGPKWIAPFV